MVHVEPCSECKHFNYICQRKKNGLRKKLYGSFACKVRRVAGFFGKVDGKFCWYRYDTRFAIPIYDDAGELARYNVFKARRLVRHAKDGKLYLYDILRTKKKRASRLSNSCTVEKLISL